MKKGVLVFTGLRIIMSFASRGRYYIVQLKSAQPHSMATIMKPGKRQHVDLSLLRSDWDDTGYGRISPSHKEWLIDTLTRADRLQLSRLRRQGCPGPLVQ